MSVLYHGSTVIHETYLWSHIIWGAAKCRGLLPGVHSKFTIFKIGQFDVPVLSKQNLFKLEVSVHDSIEVEEVQCKL